MEVKPGYNQTEVGVIPEEWHVARLGDKTTKVGSGITPTGGERVYKQDGRPFLRSQNVGWGTLLLDDIAFIDDDTHATFQGTEIKVEDVFLNITGASIGRSAVADARVARGNVNQHVCIIRTNQDQLHPRFLNYILLSTPGQRQIDSFQAGGNRQGLNFGQIRSFYILLPPITEQRAIAGTLSDVDALIGALDQVITKKRDLKQAAMQQLLTGHKRLPGFCGQWQVRALGDGIALLSGHHVLAQHCNRRGDGVPYLTGPADFPNGKIQHTKFTERPTTLCAPNDILVTVKGSGSGSLVLSDAVYCISRQLMAIRVHDWNGRFIYYSLFQNASRIKAASTGLIPGLSRSDILEQPLPLPPSTVEQTAIADVLSDMDAELAALEQRHDKTRALKLGMMQELLTGRTRFI